MLNGAALADPEGPTAALGQQLGEWWRLISGWWGWAGGTPGLECLWRLLPTLSIAQQEEVSLLSLMQVPGMEVGQPHCRELGQTPQADQPRCLPCLVSTRQWVPQIWSGQKLPGIPHWMSQKGHPMELLFPRGWR